MFNLLYQNVTNFCAICRTAKDSKSYSIEQFQIFCTPAPWRLYSFLLANIFNLLWIPDAQLWTTLLPL